MKHEQPTDEEFEIRYKPLQNHLNPNAGHCGWLYETYGEEEEYIKRIPCERVWTLVDGEDTPECWIIAGRAFVNRIGYIVTETPWETGDEQFICD